MSVSSHSSHSASCDSRNSVTVPFLASTSPVAPHRIATYPPRMIRPSWAMS